MGHTSDFRKYFISVLFIACLTGNYPLYGQSVSFALKTSPNLEFIFNTVDKYETGIIRANAVTLNIEAVGTQWDLYVGTTTTTPGKWDVVSTYASTGTLPTVDMVELQFRNASNTSQVSGFFSLTDISTPTYIIGSAVNPDPATNCPNNGTNTAGSYIGSPQCYKFNVDMRIKPGLSFRPGLYTLRVDYVIIQDL